MGTPRNTRALVSETIALISYHIPTMVKVERLSMGTWGACMSQRVLHVGRYLIGHVHRLSIVHRVGSFEFDWHCILTQIHVFADFWRQRPPTLLPIIPGLFTLPIRVRVTQTSVSFLSGFLVRILMGWHWGFVALAPDCAPVWKEDRHLLFGSVLLAHLKSMHIMIFLSVLVQLLNSLRSLGGL